MPAYSLHETWPWLRALLAFALGWLICVWPWLFGDITIPGVAKSQFYPQLIFLAQSLHSGESPWWNPYIFTGHPQIADPRALLFSPFALLAALDENPGLRAFDALAFGLIGLGGVGWIFTFRLNRWHWAGGVIAALIFCFGGAVAWRMQNIGSITSVAFFPLAFLYLEMALRRNNIFYAALAGLFAALMILPRGQLAMLGSYVLLARLIWVTLSEPKNLERLRFLAPVVLTLILVCGALVFIPVLFTYDFLLSTAKPVTSLPEAVKGSLHPAHLLTLLIPDLFASAGDAVNFWGPPSIPWDDTNLNLAQNMSVIYFGSLPVLLGGAMLMPNFWRGKSIAFIAVLLALLLVYALGKYVPAFAYFYQWLPGVKFFSRPADAGFLFGALFAPFAGYCVHRFLSADDNPLLLLIFGCLVMIGGFWLAWATADSCGQIITASPALLMSVLTFAIGALVLVFSRSILRTWPQIAACALIAFVLIDLRLHNGPNSATAAPRKAYEMLDRDTNNPLIVAMDKLLAPSSHALTRMEVDMLGAPWPNLTAGRKYYHTLGDNPLHLSWVSETLGIADRIGLAGERAFPPTYPKYDAPLPQMLGIGLFALPKPMSEISPATIPTNFSEPRQIDNAFLYTAHRSFPRLWLAESAEAVTSRQDVLTSGFPQKDYLQSVLLEDAPKELPAFARKGQVILRLYRHTEIEIEAQNTGGGYLVLADAWHPWWQATIDNQPVKIYRANLMMRAVMLPPGDHVVRFRFRPLCGLLRSFRFFAQCKS